MNIEELKQERYRLQAQGNILEEVKVLQRIADESKNIFGADSNDYLQALNELGGTQKYIGHYADAEKNLMLAKDIISKKFGENNLAYANNLLNLTEVYRYAGKTENLESIYQKITDIYIDNKADKSLEFAAVCNNFGLYYQAVSKMEEAYNKHITSYDILKARLSNDNMLEYGVTLSNLFNPSLSLGKKEQALDYMNEALEIFNKIVGKYHPLYAAAINNLAIYYYNEGNYHKALEYFEEAAKICLESMGSESDNYKNLVSNIDFIKSLTNKE